MHVAELRLGVNGVDLAHVTALVLLVHVLDVQIPGAALVVLVVRDADARITRYHVIVHGQNCRLLEVHPGNLCGGLKSAENCVKKNPLRNPTKLKVQNIEDGRQQKPIAVGIASAKFLTPIC